MEWGGDLFQALPRMWLATGGSMEAVAREDPTLGDGRVADVANCKAVSEVGRI